MGEPDERLVRPGQGDLFVGRRSAPGQLPAVRVVSVSELTRELKGILEARFAAVAVRGEISNLRPAASGHLYFTLKDQGACISAVMFQREASRLKFRLQDGQLVIARGRGSVFEPRGQYQLILESIEPEGAGALALAFEQLKQKLEKEGLFEQRRKRAVPMIPRRIGIVTSPTGAAIRDFLRVLHERFPIPVILAQARVQGAGAAQEMAAGIHRLGTSGLVDVIVLTRGGGSLEDLWAFNEEVLARAIAASIVPVVSAVGHEIDFTISDFVADRRCSTPTDAAKTLAPVCDELRRVLEKHRRHCGEIARRQLSQQRERLGHRASRLGDPRREIAHDRLALDQAAGRLEQSARFGNYERRLRMRAWEERLGREHPRARLHRLSKALAGLKQGVRETGRLRLDAEHERLLSLQKRLLARNPESALVAEGQRTRELLARSEKALARELADRRLRLSRAAGALESLSPLAVLARGYSIAFTEDGHVLKSSDATKPGSVLRLLLPDRSELEAQVTQLRRRMD